MLYTESLERFIFDIPKEEKKILNMNLIRALEYTLEDDQILDKELRNYDVNFEDLDNAIHYFELINMRQALKKSKIRNIK